MDSFASYLRRELVLRGWSQNEFARRAGVDIGLVSRWINKENEPSIPNARRIARTLGVSLSEILLVSGAIHPGELGLNDHAIARTLTNDALAGELNRRSESRDHSTDH